MRRVRPLLCVIGAAVVLTYGAGGKVFAQPSLCASVKIEIAQEAVIERQAFDARMRIRNGSESLTIEELAVSLSFRDADGAAVVASSDPEHPSALFLRPLRAPSLSVRSGRSRT